MRSQRSVPARPAVTQETPAHRDRRTEPLKALLRLLLGGALLCLLCSCVVDGTPRQDSRRWYPEQLEGHLEEAGHLAQLTSGNCQQNLAAAQRQLDQATSSPAFTIVLPRGPAHQAAIEYQIHLARASCGGDPSSHEEELRAALAAAQRAAAAYGDALDYQTMVIMQYNVAATQRTLGDTSASVASLETAIAMDEEFGFQEDAQENRALLKRWDPAASAPPAAASTPQDGPRSVELRFAGSSSDADVELETSLVRDGKEGAVHMSAARTVERQVRSLGNGGWRISYGPGAIVPGDASEMKPNLVLRGLVLPTMQELLELPAIEIGPQGELTQGAPDQPFAENLQSTALQMLSEHGQDQGPSRTDAKAIQIVFAPKVVNAQAEEDYNIMTAAWIGAKLDQGVWYRTEMNLMMPGIRQLVLAHDVEFAFTRRVPCVEGMPERSCVEIVVHASPRPESANQAEWALTQVLHMPRLFGYWSATYMRIVVDAATLTPYLRDTRRYWNMCYQDPPCNGESTQEKTVWRSRVPRPVTEASKGRAGS